MIGAEEKSLIEDQPEFPQIIFASDCSILIRFGDSISRQIHEEVFKVFNLLSSLSLETIRSIHPAYNSILVTINCMQKTPASILETIRELVFNSRGKIPNGHRLIEIPVCYEEEYAPDISFVADHNKVNIDEVIKIHSQENYLVYFLGFSPGFPYLGDMAKEISTPRLEKPRLYVPEGSVAIGGSQTGIYPVSSPGGWRIIGRTPLQLYTPMENEPTLLKMGDFVKFIPISISDFEKIKSR